MTPGKIKPSRSTENPPSFSSLPAGDERFLELANLLVCWLHLQRDPHQGTGCFEGKTVQKTGGWTRGEQAESRQMNFYNSNRETSYSLDIYFVPSRLK